MESRKSPKLSRANQEGQRSPRLPTKKPPVRSPSLTRREFSMDGITEVDFPSWFFRTLHKIKKIKPLLCVCVQSTTTLLKSLLTYGEPNSRLWASPHSSLPTSVQVNLHVGQLHW